MSYTQVQNPSGIVLNISGIPITDFDPEAGIVLDDTVRSMLALGTTATQPTFAGTVKTTISFSLMSWSPQSGYLSALLQALQDLSGVLPSVLSSIPGVTAASVFQTPFFTLGFKNNPSFLVLSGTYTIQKQFSNFKIPTGAENTPPREWVFEIQQAIPSLLGATGSNYGSGS